MENRHFFQTIPCARLISMNPEKPDIHFSHEDPTSSTQWKIYQKQAHEIFIKNVSLSLLQIDDTLLEINQERKLYGGEKLSFGQNKETTPPGPNYSYVFYLENAQPDIKRDETLQKLFKIEADLQKELTCPICTNFLHKCMILIPCQHSLCSFCLFDYLKLSNECPLCRVQAVSVTKNPVLSNLVQLAVDNFPNLTKSTQARKDFEQIDFPGVIVRNEEGLYVGSLLNNKREGQGKMIYKDGIIYEGSWKNAKREGKGVMILANGNKYDGSWGNNQFNGLGKFIWSNGQEYEGDFQDGKIIGYGTMKYANGGFYQGDWKNGKREGKGITAYPCGDKYEGAWANDVISGTGKYFWSNGQEYEGDFQNNYRDGSGTMKFEDGSIYQGNWKNDKKEGNGVLTLSNKDKCEGKWANDSLLSKVKIDYSNGDQYEGEIDCRDFKKKGKGIFISKNGDKYEGYWSNDQKHGNGRQVTGDGEIIHEGIWKEGTVWTVWKEADGKKFKQSGRNYKKKGARN